MGAFYCYILNRETGEIERYEVVEVKTYTKYNRGAEILKDGKKVRYYYRETQVGKYVNGKVFTENPNFSEVGEVILDTLKAKVSKKKHEYAMAKDIYNAVKKNFEG